MRSRWFHIQGLCWLTAFSVAALAQPGKMAIGIDYGSSPIQRGSVTLWSIDVPLTPSGALIPKNVRGSIELGLGSNWGLRFSAGYGYTREKSEINGANYRWEAKFTSSGFPVEGTMLFSVPLDKEKRFAAHFGLGCGYYSYKFKSEGLNESTNGSTSPNPNQGFSGEELKISGPAQFFVGGFSLGIASKMRATFEFSKLGLSWLKEKQNSEHSFNFTPNDPIITYTEMREDDYPAGSGFDDVALSFGINLNLGK